MPKLISVESVEKNVAAMPGHKSLLVNPFENKYLEQAEQDANMRTDYDSKKLSSGELATVTSTSCHVSGGKQAL